MSAGHVTAFALARYTGENAEKTKIAAASLTIPLAARRENALTVTQRQMNQPLHGDVFQYGETVSYEIRVTNHSAETAYQVQVCSSLVPSCTGQVAAAEMIQPGEAFSCVFAHTVTAEEAQAGHVISAVFAVYRREGQGLDYAEADSLMLTATRSDTASDSLYGSLSLPLDDAADGCFRTLTVKGTSASEYTRHFCPRHAAVVKLVQTLTQQGDGAAASWRQAALLWQDEMDALCEQYIEAAHGTAQMAVMKERTAFLRCCADYEALLLLLYPDHPEYAAQKTAEMLMLRCLELCDGLHHAGQPRRDSVSTGSYARIMTTGTLPKCSSVNMMSQTEDALYREQLCMDHSPLEEIADGILDAENSPAAWDTVCALWQTALRAELNEIAQVSSEAQAALLRLAASLSQYDAMHGYMLALLYPREPGIASEAAAQGIRDQVITLCQIQP